MPAFFMVREFKLTEVIYRLDFAPQFTLSDLTHIGGLILQTALRLQERDYGRIVAVLSLQQRHATIST